MQGNSNTISGIRVWPRFNLKIKRLALGGNSEYEPVTKGSWTLGNDPVFDHPVPQPVIDSLRKYEVSDLPAGWQGGSNDVEDGGFVYGSA